MTHAFLNPEFGALGLLMNNPSHIELFAAEVKPDDFQSPLHRRAYEAMTTAYAGGLKISIVALATWAWDQRDVLDFLVHAATEGPHTINPQYFIDLLKARQWKSKAATVLNDAAQEASHVGTLPDAVRMSGKIDKLAASLSVAESIRDKIPSKGFSLVTDAMAKLGARLEKKEIFSTGLKCLDTLLGGWQPSNYYVLAAVTGHGKTLFGTSFANAAASQGKHTLYATIEMEKNQIVDRIVCTRTRIPISSITKGVMTEREIDRAYQEYQAIEALPLSVAHLSNASFEEFEGHCKRLKKSYQLDFVVLDYLQDLKISGESFRSQYEHISAITTRIRNLCHALKIPILALAQLNRDAQVDSTALPKKSQIRGSGQIENDADVVLLIHHDFESHGLTKRLKDSWVLIAKNRHGPESQVPVVVDFATNRVTDLGVSA